MVTLAKRATPLQARIMRVVEGAVKNAIDAHPNLSLERMARSIAKRAAGTLSALADQALAAGVPSERGRETTRYLAAPRSSGTIGIPGELIDMMAQAHIEGRGTARIITNPNP